MHTHTLFVRKTMLFRRCLNYVIAQSRSQSEANVPNVFGCASRLVYRSRITTGGRENPKAKNRIQTATIKKEKAPDLAKQMSTPATANTSGERYANECSVCFWASLPDAGEPRPTSGLREREKAEKRGSSGGGRLNGVWLALNILAFASAWHEVWKVHLLKSARPAQCFLM